MQLIKLNGESINNLLDSTNKRKIGTIIIMKKKSAKRKVIAKCRSINPFIHYYQSLRESFGKQHSSRVIAKIAAYRWEFMEPHVKERYIEAARKQWLRRRKAAMARKK